MMGVGGGGRTQIRKPIKVCFPNYEALGPIGLSKAPGNKFAHSMVQILNRHAEIGVQVPRKVIEFCNTT